ncbi:MAG: hypothetical protein B7Y80_18730 [Hyphomicrobium sp. 32-62-53]|nr:MAG: hypothetical protein B7Z29_17425 [Hyphomicrobium sp. 12-62-95]OYX97657.1 MAG: hypothetical protein B7Y80_18730 [Hyphomicrobium sp. 32-62-53]
MTALCVSLQNDVISIRVPIALRRHGGKTHMVLPETVSNNPRPGKPDDTLIRALAKAKHWQAQMDGGAYRSLGDFAKRRKINASYVSRILRLNDLAPDIKAAILDGRQPPTMDMLALQKPFPDLRHEQLAHFGLRSGT